VPNFNEACCNFALHVSQLSYVTTNYSISSVMVTLAWYVFGSAKLLEH